MSSKYVELKVGLLVLLGAAILVFAIWLAKGYRYGQKYYTVSVMFPEVGTLATGDPVTVSGVRMGKVQDVALDKGEVRVDIDIDQTVKLKEDATFMIKNFGMMGERFIAVKTGMSDAPLDLSNPPRGDFDPGIPEVMGMMGDVIDNMNGMVNALEKSVMSPQTLDKFSETVANLHTLTTRLEKSTRTYLPKIDTAVGNIAEMTESLKASVDANKPHLENAAQNFDSASTKLIALLSSLDSTSASLKSFAYDLDNSDGTLRMLMEDRRLYDDLRTTAHRLDSLILDVRENPRKYINLKVEIF
ncbi:MAG: MlaD family protein [Candidatus Zixiibacteriota bacterium]